MRERTPSSIMVKPLDVQGRRAPHFAPASTTIPKIGLFYDRDVLLCLLYPYNQSSNLEGGDGSTTACFCGGVTMACIAIALP